MIDKKKILILTDDFPPDILGGAGLVSAIQAVGLSSIEGNIVRVFTTNRNRGNITYRYKNVDVVSVASNYDRRLRSFFSLYNRRVLKELRKVIIEFNPDVVHAHNIHSDISYAALKIAKENGCKTIITFHDTMPVSYGKVFPNKNADFDYKLSILKMLKDNNFAVNPFKNYLIRRYLKYADIKISVSNSLRLFLGNNGIDNIEVIYNGVNDREMYDNEKIYEYKKSLGLISSPVLFFGGRLNNAKGLKVTLEALKKVIMVIPNIKILLVGKVDGIIENILSSSINEDIRSSIVSLGWIENSDIDKVYGISDVVLVPSVYLDPFPTINLEAMINGRPVIGTKFGGTKEAVEDGVTGLIINPNNIDEYSDSIIKIINDYDMREQMGRYGKKRVLEKFNNKTTISKIMECYNR